jgi:hypothetical protein
MAVIPAAAFASPARVAGLNVPGDYIKDYTGIYTYISGVNSVGNLVYVEPTPGNQSMGAVLGNLWDGRLGTWSIHLREFHPALGQAIAFDPITTSNLFGDPNTAGEAIDIMWGRRMGAGNLGIRLNRTFQSFDDGTDQIDGAGNTGRNILGLGVGYGFAMNENTDIEVSGIWQDRSFEDPTAGVGTPAVDDGGTTYQIAGRAMMKAGPSLLIMPVAKLYSFDVSSLDGTPAPAVATEIKLSGWQLGLAGNWTIGTDDLFVLGAQFVGNTAKSTVGAAPTVETSETYYPNVFMALETHVTSWLTFRFGAQNAFLYTIKQDPIEAKLHTFTYNMGTGVKLGSLQLDATLESGFWNNPIANSWNNPGGSPFGRVSATYSF